MLFRSRYGTVRSPYADPNSHTHSEYLFTAPYGSYGFSGGSVRPHALGDALFYGSVWWSWVFPDGVVGLIIGLFAAKYAIREGGFGTTKVIVFFNVIQVVSNAVAWILVAPVLDIAIYAEPVNKVFVQGIFAFIGNIIIIGILGTLLCVGYSAIGAKSSSLTKED